MHSPMRTLQDTLRVWRMFEQFVAEMTVKQIGLSNCYNPDLLLSVIQAAKVKPSIM